MSKFRTIFMAVMAAGILVSLPSLASAQLPQSVVDQLTPKYRQQGPCRDPWITIAINDAFANTHTIGGVGDSGECQASKYNNGSWSSYAELYRGVKTAFNNMAAAHLVITKEALPDGKWKTTTKSADGKFVHHDIVSHDGGTLLASDGASLIVASVVAQGGGNFIGVDAGNGARVVPQTGGNLVGLNDAGMTVSQKKLFAVSNNEMRVYLGGSVLILKK